MTISYDLVVSMDEVKHVIVNDVIKVCPGKNGIHYWRKAKTVDKVFNHFLSFASGYDNIRIFD